MGQNWYLSKVEDDHEITRETDAEFLLEYQHAILLECREQGALTEMQYRYATEALQQLRPFLREFDRSCREGVFER